DHVDNRVSNPDDVVASGSHSSPPGARGGSRRDCGEQAEGARIVSPLVMAGLVPAIYVLTAGLQKRRGCPPQAGHDGFGRRRITIAPLPPPFPSWHDRTQNSDIQMPASKELVFSGVQPTGNLHLGNYLGAIKRFVDMQAKYDCIYCVVDMHAITVWQEPVELKRTTREVAAAYIASGIDPKKNIIFNQSQVAEHAELAWVLNCVARLGWLNRMTQFKEKVGKDRENASVGLYAYPSLMAADILVYRATHVPV